MQIEYGPDAIDAVAIRDSLRTSKLSSRQLAEVTSISRADISAFAAGKANCRKINWGDYSRLRGG
jgi:predicted XRE-type DNA-binding protein